MTDTPETDANCWRENVSEWTAANFARKLERERDEAREALADWENAAEHVKADHPDEVHCGCVKVLRKLLSDALRERNEARAERDEWIARFRADELLIENAMLTATPLTDDIARGNHVVPTEFAQDLEQERDQARHLAESAMWEADRLRSQLWRARDRAWKLARERNRLKSQISNLQSP